MDRKKTIVAAVMINAGILTVLFIAAMTMREEPVAEPELGRANARLNDPKPLFKEIVEIPTPAPLAVETQSSPAAPPVSFALPAVAFEEQKPALASAPEAQQAPAVLATTAPAIAAQPTASAASQPSSAVEIEVQKGDSLEKLAKKHHTSVDEIIKLNQLPSSFLRVGQRLKISTQKTIEGPKPKAALPAGSDHAEYYTMKVGDNPWSIAMKHHMKVDELLKLNGLNEKSARKLKPGDRLKIR